MTSLTVLKTFGDAVVLSYERTFSQLEVLIRLWDETTVTLIAEGVQLLEDSGTWECEGVVRLEPSHGKDTLEYGIVDTNSALTLRFAASKVVLIEGEGNSEQLSRQAPNGLVKPWRNGTGGLTNGSYTVFGARQAKHTTGKLSDGVRQFFYRVDDEALTLDAAAYADQTGLWVENRATVYGDELIGVTGDGTPTHWINVYRRDPGGRVAPYVHGSPGNRPS